MNKTLITAVCLLVSSFVFSQKTIGDLIAAERSFAAFSVAHSTKEAFEAFIDSNSVMFEGDKPVKAVDFWSKREKKPGVLNWYPQVAEIASSGNFGFTTGPWTFRASPTDTVAARGQYMTVWYLDKSGNWKFLVDLGADAVPAVDSSYVRIFDMPRTSGAMKAVPHIYPLVAAEKQCNQQFRQNRLKAYHSFLSAQSVLVRTGRAPALLPAEQSALIRNTPAKAVFQMEGWGVSVQEDMGYTYGIVTVNGKKDNYMRIWRHEKKGWVIAAEVVRYQ